jgi:polyribonucleotide nucleotidyltransferase
MKLNFPFKQELTLWGKPLIIQTGLLAKQADANVIVTMGQTTVMATVVVGKAKLELDYFPLQVIFEERMYASGKIRGSRFQKREGRPTDNAILNGRMIDRSLRSLFDQNLKNDIQIVITPLSIDEANQPDTLAVLASSLALQIAGISSELFKGPVSCVRIGKINSQIIIMPTYEEVKNSDYDIAVSASKAGVCMLEAGMNLISKEELKIALKVGLEACIELNNVQVEFLNKMEVKISTKLVVDNSISSYEHLFDDQTKVITDLVYNHQYQSEKNESLDHYLKEYIDTKSKEDSFDKSTVGLIKTAFYDKVKKIIQTNILEKGLRPDGRKLQQIRPLESMIDILPMVHGSGLFNRGATQVLNVLTLGTLRDALSSDDMEDFQETTKRYLHHYNFPPFSVGETGRYGAPSRREVGHGALAEKALLPVIPSEEIFPYTMRLVSECLGSNGSTSMASTCASSLSLMSGGVPILAHVGGIAMGVVVDEKSDNYAVLTDIQGMEDHFGHMDFKLTGTSSGLTALQLDNKLAGISLTVLNDAIDQAQVGLEVIIASLDGAIKKPKLELAPTAPMVIQMLIPYDKIGDVIGTQGKIIKKIINKTNTEIDIAEDDSGRTTIYGKSQADVLAAKSIIEALIKEYFVGETIDITISRQVQFGYFGEILGTDKEVLLHNKYVGRDKVLSIGQVVNCQIIGINDKKQLDIKMTKLDANQVIDNK